MKKNILQAAALIIIAASAIAAAATSRHPVHETCNREWEMRFEKINHEAGSISAVDSNAINHKK